eukprot:scaffold85212_cov55-Phaeocystis_antarctica.AAC.2
MSSSHSKNAFETRETYIRCRLRGSCGTVPAATVRVRGVLGFHRRSIVQRPRPLEVRCRILEVRCRARLRLPSSTAPGKHRSPHAESPRKVRRRPHNPRRQRLEPVVVPPLRFGHLGALLLQQHFEGACRGLCPVLRAHRTALLGLKEPLCGLHVVPRVREHATEAEVRLGLVGPQGDGLAVGLGCFAPVLLRGVPPALSEQLRVRVARLRGEAGPLPRDLASPLLPHPAILLLLPQLPHPLVKRPVQLPNAGVRRAVDAAEVRRRQLLVVAHIADGVLLTLVVHV